MIAAVIFDLYGTLLRNPLGSQPYYQLARRNPRSNIRLALETALTCSNPTLDNFASNIGLPPQDDMSILEADLQNDIAHIHSFVDAVPTLTALKQRGLLTAVISNLATPYKKPFFTQKLNDLVDVTVFSCDCGILKPNPDIYRVALEQLGIPANNTIMVGDSFKSDVDGPAKIGIVGIHLVRSGDSSPANCAISSLHDVLDKVT